MIVLACQIHLAQGQDITSGIISKYNFEGDALDLVGSNHGIVIGATPSDDRFGNPNSAYYFDGLNDYIEILNSPTLNFQATDDFSISVWVNVDSIQYDIRGNNNEIIGKWNTYKSTGYPFAIRYWNNYAPSDNQQRIFSLRYDSENCGHNPLITADCAITSGEWHHLVLIKSGSTLLYYQDGILLGTATDNTSLTCNTQNSNPIYIGKRDLNTRYFTGFIDDLVFYNRALSADEVNMLFSINNWSYTPPPDPQEIIAFNIPDQASSQIIDSTKTILVVMPCYSNLEALTPEFTLAADYELLWNNMLQISGSSSLDFRDTVVYQAVNKKFCISTYWQVIVEKLPPEKSTQEILTFNIPNQINSTIIDTTKSIYVKMQCYTDLTQLSPIFEVRSGIQLYVDGLIQTSGVSVNNFSDTITYVAIEKSKCVQTNWQVIVTLDQISNSEQDSITSFINIQIEDQVAEPVIDSKNKTILFTVECDSELDNLALNFVISNSTDFLFDGKIYQSGNTFNFSKPILVELTNNEKCATTIWQLQAMRYEITTDSLLENEKFFIPNVITPNSDSKNEKFEVGELLIGSSITIVNRHGIKVFNSDSYQNNFTGRNLSPGIYYYSIQSSCLEKPIVGTLSIVH